MSLSSCLVLAGSLHIRFINDPVCTLESKQHAFHGGAWRMGKLHGGNIYQIGFSSLVTPRTLWTHSVCVSRVWRVVNALNLNNVAYT